MVMLFLPRVIVLLPSNLERPFMGGLAPRLDDIRL